MGVSVRMSRNVRVNLPFWLAIPLYVLVGVVWAVIVFTAGIVDGVRWLARRARAARASVPS
jgi:hypothetical protein